MTVPSKIDARKSDAKTWKMTPTWRQNGGRNPSKNMKKQYKKTSRKMMQKLSAKKLYARRGLGPRVPEEVRSSSGDSRSIFPLASNILQTTNTWQTTKKQPRTSNSHLARTWRAGRHGADLLIYWAHWPSPFRPTAAIEPSGVHALSRPPSRPHCRACGSHFAFFGCQDSRRGWGWGDHFFI